MNGLVRSWGPALAVGFVCGTLIFMLHANLAGLSAIPTDAGSGSRYVGPVDAGRSHGRLRPQPERQQGPSAPMPAPVEPTVSASGALELRDDYSVVVGGRRIELDHGQPPPADFAGDGPQPGQFSTWECTAYTIPTGVCLGDPPVCRQTCYFSNVGFNGRTGKFVIALDSAHSELSPPPQYGNNEHPMQVEYTRLPLSEYAAVNNLGQPVWRRNRTIVFQEMYHEDNYYHLMVDSFGGLFWMAWDMNRLQDVDVLLVNQPDPRFPYSSFISRSPALHVGQLGSGMTCFTRLAVGPGHRALWWSSTQWEFSAAFSDFLGAIDPPYTGSHPLMARDTRAENAFRFVQSPAAVFARSVFTRGFANVPAAQHEWPPNVVLIKRPAGGARAITNQDELVSALQRHFAGRMGTVTLLDAAVSQEETARVLARTSVLIGAHGAGLANMVFLPAHSVVVEMFGTGHINPAETVLSWSLGHRHMVWRPHGAPADCQYPTYAVHCRHASITVDVYDFLLLMENALSTLRAQQLPI